MTMAAASRSVLARGSTSTIYDTHDRRADRVVKVLDGHDAVGLFDLERRVLARLCSPITAPSRPASLLAYFGIDPFLPRGLVLERAAGGSVYDLLFTHLATNPPPDRVVRRWAREAAEALAFAHRHGVWHGDIHVANFLIDGRGGLRVADWGAAVVDGEGGRLRYRRTHQLWTRAPSPSRPQTPSPADHTTAETDGEIETDADGIAWRRETSVASELFALGCALFHLEAGRDAFDDLQDDADRHELLRRLRGRDMPCVDSLSALGPVIRKCWAVEYASMEDVLVDLQALCHDKDDDDDDVPARYFKPR